MTAISAYRGPPESPPVRTTLLANLAQTNGPWRLDNLPAFPCCVPPGGALSFDVTYAPTAVRSNNSQVIIESSGSNVSRVEVQLTGQGRADYLAMTPATGFASQGAPGGPFSPNSLSYALSNAGPSALNWTAWT